MSAIQIIEQPQELVITLKEITDLIEVRHDKAMLKIEELSKEPSFGSLSKMDIQYKSGKGRIATIQTYHFTKKQAIAVGAKLNNSLLMKVIDRLEELETKKVYQLPKNFSEALRLAADLEEKNQQLENTITQKDEIIVTVAELNIKAGDVSFEDFAKNLAIKNLGRNNIIKFCKARNYLRENTAPYQPYINRGYFRRLPSEKPINGEIRYTTYLTPRGTVWLAKIIKAEYEIEEKIN